MMTHVRWICLTISCLLAGTSSPLQADDGQRKLVAAGHAVVTKGAAWGVINSLSDGSLGLVVQRARALDAIDAVNVCMEWMRSTDGGQTWSEPVLISERRGPDGELFADRADGGKIVFQQRNQSLGQLPSGRIVCAFCELNYHYTKDGKTDNRPGKNYNHANQGIVYTWSDDLGQTWVPTRKMSDLPVGGPGGGISPHWRIVTFEDGAAMMSLYGTYNPEYRGKAHIPPGTKKLSAVIRSTDNGETWNDASVVMAKPDGLTYEETALCLVDDKLLAHVRTPLHDVVQYVSLDDGRTWAGPTPVTEPQQQPGGAFRLSSGKLLFTWGNRRAPFGAAAMISSDGGQTWDYEHRVLLGDKGVNPNCGYANGAQAGDGTIVVVYYVMPVSEDYRGLWTGSTIYTVRFTEDEFLEAAAN